MRNKTEGQGIKQIGDNIHIYNEIRKELRAKGRISIFIRKNLKQINN